MENKKFFFCNKLNTLTSNNFRDREREEEKKKVKLIKIVK